MNLMWYGALFIDRKEDYRMKIVKKIITFFIVLGVMTSGIAAYASDDKDETVIDETKETTAADNTDSGITDEEPELEISIDELDKDRIIHNGITVGTTDISGMTVSDAHVAVEKEIEDLSHTKVIMKVDDRNIETELLDLGFSCDNAEESIVKSALMGYSGNLIRRYKDISEVNTDGKVFELSYSISRDTVSEFMAGTADSYTIKPVNATIKRNGSGFDLTESSTGIQIDQGATIDAVMKAFDNWNHDTISLDAVTVVLQPDYNYEDLTQIKDCIGSFSTKLSTDMSRGKGRNVIVGAAKIDGTVIMPGQTWSVYETLSPFTIENGYDAGTAYFNGGYVQEIGGGVCQLATTLYNTALRAEITVAERFCHQMTVGYTEISFDATVNDYGTKDLKLKNDFDFPVYIEAYYSNGNVCFNMYGVETRDPRRTLGFRSEVLSEEYPTNVEETPDPSMPAGTKKMIQKAYPKVIAKAYKQIYYDGVLIEEDYLHTDNYHASPAKYLVGTGQ